MSRFPYLFRDVPPGALFEHDGALFIKTRGKARPHDGNPRAARLAFRPLAVVNVSQGEARGATPARIVMVADVAAPYREQWTRHKPGGSVIACRFVVYVDGRWRRLYSDRAAAGVPHFVRVAGERVPVTGVAP